jgi:hypothetical protein
MRTTGLLTVILLLVPAAALAQQAVLLPVGTRVRFTPEDRTQDLVIGSVAGRRPDTLLVWTEQQDTVRVPLRNGWLETSRGVHGHAGKGAIYGFFGGAVAGAALGAALGDPGFFSKGDIVLLSTLIAAPAGALLGTLIGSAIRTERWDEVSQGALRIGISPGPRGARLVLGATMRF